MAASYSLSGIGSSFQKSFVNSFYNYIYLLTTVLQAEFNKIPIFPLISHGFIPTFLFLSLFPWLVFVGNYCCWSLFLTHFAEILEGWILCTDNFYELGMNNLYESVNAMKWKSENRLWIVSLQIVSHKSFNVRLALNSKKKQSITLAKRKKLLYFQREGIILLKKKVLVLYSQQTFVLVETYWRRLQCSISCLPRRLQDIIAKGLFEDVLKMSCKQVWKTSSV